MSNRAIVRQFANWQAAGESLALVTVVATEGSTYSKAGRHILIRPGGEYAGLVSGGCLEGDLAQHAEAVIETGEPKLLTYDMRDEADEIWGMGVGCNGLIQVLLQRLEPAHDWKPFGILAEAMASSSPHVATLITHSQDATIPVGTLRLRDQAGSMIEGPAYPAPPKQLPALLEHDNGTLALHWQINPWPRLLLLGAGPDAEPVCALALAQGWEVCVADHRSTLLASAGFEQADRRCLLEPQHLADELDLAAFSAVVVMSHHLETDRHYLQQLADHMPLDKAHYLGALGPAARRGKLLAGLDNPPAGFANFLHGPVGLDIGADSPESIALALISEIQAVIAGCGGGPLSVGQTR